MNFFEHQDRAKASTTKLVVLFIVAVIAILLAINALAWGVMQATGWGKQQTDQFKSANSISYPVGVDGGPDLDHPVGGPRVRGRRSSAGRPADPPQPPLSPWVLHGLVTVATLVVIGGGSLFKTAQLSSGGSSVALQLGGRPLDASAADPAEQKLRNVVEEMAIASGTPVPKIFVLDHEKGINAFAAGFSPRSAVIGVTRGAIEQLDRDELQGVIAHEFSHILNGDMRLNMRMIGVLYGILVIGLIGQILFRTVGYAGSGRSSRSSRERGGGGQAVLIMVAAGVALWLIGSVGMLFGRIIQAAISRQREFLADASAVQFTRNPDGIGNALKKLGGLSSKSRVADPHASEMSHLFFASYLGITYGRLLATHPPLAERIKRIDPSFNGKFAKISDSDNRQAVQSELVDALDADSARNARLAAGIRGFSETLSGDGRLSESSPAGLSSGLEAAASYTGSPPPLPGGRYAVDTSRLFDGVGRPRPEQIEHAVMLIADLPAALKAAAHDPFSARAVVLAMLIPSDAQSRDHQLAAIDSSDPPLAGETRRVHMAVRSLGPTGRLPLVELSLPALRGLSSQQQQTFIGQLNEQIQFDRQITMFELALYRIVTSSLQEERPGRTDPRQAIGSLRALIDPIRTVMSALARASAQQTQRSYEAAGRALGMELPPVHASIDAREFDQALLTLTKGTNGVKRRIVEAAAQCVSADGSIEPAEAELLRAVAAVLNLPVPPVARRPEDAPA